MRKLHVFDVARVCHETNRRYRAAIGESDLGAWGEISEEKRASIVTGVQAAMDSPHMTARESHDRWTLEQVNAGHVNLKPFDELAETQQLKDVIFLGIVNALRPFVEE